MYEELWRCEGGGCYCMSLRIGNPRKIIVHPRDPFFSSAKSRLTYSVLSIVNRSNKTETDAEHAGYLTPCLIYPQQ
jgi:hypothetical protein